MQNHEKGCMAMIPVTSWSDILTLGSVFMGSLKFDGKVDLPLTVKTSVLEVNSPSILANSNYILRYTLLYTSRRLLKSDVPNDCKADVLSREVRLSLPQLPTLKLLFRSVQKHLQIPFKRYFKVMLPRRQSFA